MELEVFSERVVRLFDDVGTRMIRIWGYDRLGEAFGICLERHARGILPAQDPFDLNDLPLRAGELRGVAVPDPSTYRVLPFLEEQPNPPPCGFMLCDLYGIHGDQLVRRHEAVTPDTGGDAGSVGGVRGPGVEFFYTEGDGGSLITEWDLLVPVYRDGLTPAVPRRTLEAMFQVGVTSGSGGSGAAGFARPSGARAV